VTNVDDLSSQLAAASAVADPIARAQHLMRVRGLAVTVIAAAIDQAVADAAETKTLDDIAEALGISTHEVRRRLTAHRARIGKPGRPGRRASTTTQTPKEKP